MKEKDNELEFSLEDIIREFSSHPQEPEAPEEEEPVTTPDIEPEAVPEPEPIPEPVPEPVAEPESGTIQEVSAVEDTIVLNTDELAAMAARNEAAMDDQTVPFNPITDADPPVTPVQTAATEIPEGAEPFSAGWEPEYDQPIGEYIPPEPIVFRPHSRLGELKKKLVAGPERRYYALMEQGVGKYQIFIFLNLLVVILAVASIVMHQMDMVQENRMRLLVFGELFAMVFSALLGSERILEGFAAMFKGKFNLDSLLTVTFLVCIADGVFCLQEVRVPFCAAFCLEMTMALWAEYQRRSTEMGQMDTLRKANRLNRVARGEDCLDGRPGFYVTDGQVEDFMDTYAQPTAPEKALNLYALIAFLASAAVGLVAGIKSGVSAGLHTWSAAILAAAPVTVFISQSRPMAILERRLHKLGTVICGWKGADAANCAGAIPLTDSDLLPAGSVKINGVKFYSDRDTDLTIAYATALMTASGSCLGDLFTQLLESRNGLHFDVDNLRIYESGGLGGEIGEEPILVGTLSFMQAMGVDMPEGTRVNQAVYVAVDGELCGLFALTYGKLKGVGAGLSTLCGYRNLSPVLTSDNFLLTESFIRSKYGVNTRRFLFPSLEERARLAAWNPQESVPCALTTQEGLASAAYGITGARALRTASILGSAVHMIGGIFGIILVLVLALVGATDRLTAANLLLFELIWAIPGLLVTERTRHI